MRLKRLEIYGFKSFADRTVVVFDEGITGIVGPNGSGKSNLSDAVRWVLGEQSAKALRGGKMEDVIFNGTQKRKRLGYCEVSLVFDNEDHALAVDFAEVMITRRVYRSGEGEYYINKAACRLRDIIELFRDTGVGKEGYSIIGQGRIGEILSQKSEDRRGIFEEAAGIVKYRTRKEESEKRLSNMRDNLSRVEDIISELESQLEPLAKASETARHYLALRDELRVLECSSFVLRSDRAKERIADAEAMLTGLREAIEQEERRAGELSAARDSASETALELENGEILECDHAIFAIGHSARDTFEMLDSLNIPMEPKPFAMGVRIEHKQTTIDVAQYGRPNPVLPPADYKLVKHLEDGTVYTFCMCPGGYVVAAASEEGRVVTNGMSYADRDGENANAALLVTVNPEEFPYDGNLGGMKWQRDIEEAAYRVSGSYKAPAQLVGDFLQNKPSTGAGEIQPTYRPGVHWCDLRQVLPERITDAIKEALPLLEGNLKGFASDDAVLTAPETRSSSPVRILRDESRQSALRGLYPSGEGAGYAGGIMSAAIDGMMSAEALIEHLGGNAHE